MCLVFFLSIKPPPLPFSYIDQDLYNSNLMVTPVGPFLDMCVVTLYPFLVSMEC